jgi:murein L,D-transpeptidase YcbB/YkuD
LAWTGRALLAAAAIAAATPVAAAPRAAFRIEAARTDLAPDVAAFYRARAYRPVWVDGNRLRPEASAVAAMISQAQEDGLSPDRYGASALQAALAAAQTGDRRALARAETLLTQALTAYAVDLHRPYPDDALILTDPALPKPLARQDVLAAIGDGAALGARIEALRRMHPAYEDLRRALALYKSEWSGLPHIDVPPGPALKVGSRGRRVELLGERLGEPAKTDFDDALARRVTAFQAAHGLPQTGQAGPLTIAALNRGPAAYERQIRRNLDRARALPGEPGERHLVVDAGGAELWLYEGERRVDQMKVVVGKPATPTPIMAGVVRYAVLNPYWNIPEDLVRDSLSPRIVKLGARQFQKERLEALSDWTEEAKVVDPARIDWRAVAAGRKPLRVRQRPGPDNMMGKVKFMLPNRLGVYLHDTPNKAPFKAGDRFLSSGCVRLEDAAKLGRWLEGAEPRADARPEQRVDLNRPTPVYITYFTVAAGPDGRAVFHPDRYGRDKTLLTASTSGR